MKITFNYSKRDVSKPLEELITQKMKKIEKYFRGEPIVDVALKADGKAHSMKMNVLANGNNFTVNSTSEDMYKNVDLCLEKLKTQVKKSKMEYRTDSRKVNKSVSFKEKHNLEQPIDLE